MDDVNEDNDDEEEEDDDGDDDDDDDGHDDNVDVDGVSVYYVWSMMICYGDFYNFFYHS